MTSFALYVLPAFLAVAFAVPASAAAPSCPLVRAVYTPLDADDDMSAEDGVTNAYEITHVAGPSGESDRPWLLRISETRQKLSYDFAVVHPSAGFGGAHVLLVRPAKATAGRKGDPTPSSRLFYFGEDLRRLDPEADVAAEAPLYVQLPEISPGFWNWKHDGRRFVPPDGIWKLAACRDRP